MSWSRRKAVNRDSVTGNLVEKKLGKVLSGHDRELDNSVVVVPSRLDAWTNCFNSHHGSNIAIMSRVARPSCPAFSRVDLPNLCSYAVLLKMRYAGCE